MSCSFASFSCIKTSGSYPRVVALCRSNPAPLSLCFPPHSVFDLKNDTVMCPPERNALKHFYDSSKGQEWTNDGFWVHEYESHCSWHGVTCDPTNTTVIMLELPGNGLSGTLSERIADLSTLEVLDVSDNDINVGYISCGVLDRLFDET